MAAAVSTFARRWRWRWKWRTRDAVVALLIASVLAPPLLLYGGAPISLFSGPIRTDKFNAVKEPIHTVAFASDNGALKSDNILAAAVVVNSTIVHSKALENHVFHIVTDKLNYAAMRMWFLANSQGKAAVEVQNIGDLTWLNSSYNPVLKQQESHFMIDYYFKTQQDKPDKNPKFQNPKYLSILNHLSHEDLADHVYACKG
ncbi:hypothetical protein E2562_018176 [Oryza meyeriana var. granulata]|uniref:Hexosyltransferase n=1 Tax=Oryza meyeriana var. granulata TaxID=110450 RepID=A0A6G1C746_9ORYZ|nr:hypothetical protein E2562_018176 [Oryza meyeriana var. granulata]